MTSYLLSADFHIQGKWFMNVWIWVPGQLTRNIKMNDCVTGCILLSSNFIGMVCFIHHFHSLINADLKLLE